MIIAKNRDEECFSIGDEVRCLRYSKYVNEIFIVEDIIENPGGCESGYMVVVALKSDRTKKILGFKKDGHEFIDGLDTNWFTKKL